MNALTQAIYNVLVNDQQLTTMLSDYKGAPAIFTVQPIPEDVKLPYVIVSGNIADAPWDTKLELGREVVRDVRCFTAATGSYQLVEAIAERVRELFHRQKIAVTGYNNVYTTCSGPIVNMTTSEVYGLVVTITFKLEVA